VACRNIMCHMNNNVLDLIRRPIYVTFILSKLCYIHSLFIVYRAVLADLPCADVCPVSSVLHLAVM
jgi:hypothetical protein